MSRCLLYVGNLPMDIREKELDDLFGKYGRITRLDIKIGARPPAFAFVEFEDDRDADDAIRGRDGYEYAGSRLRVEMSRGSRSRGPPSRYGQGPPNRGSGARPGSRTEFRLRVSGLPISGSWQDIKDHFREAGDVTFADSFRDGFGVVEFSNRSDMEYAIEKLDDTKFRSHEGESSYIRVKPESQSSGGGRQRSRSRSPRRRSPSPRRRSPSPRRRSPSPRRRSPSPRRNDRDRSRSRSPRRDRSPSPRACNDITDNGDGPLNDNGPALEENGRSPSPSRD